MALGKEAFCALVSFALTLAYGCGTVGWLPSVSVAVAGIDRTGHQREQREGEKLILKAEARLIWKLKPAELHLVTHTVEEQRSAISQIDCRTRRASALREWEIRERIRVIDQTNRGWIK